MTLPKKTGDSYAALSWVPPTTPNVLRIRCCSCSHRWGKSLGSLDSTAAYFGIRKMNTIGSVTRWLNYFKIFGHLKQWKFGQSQHFCQNGIIFCQILNSPLKICPRFIKLCQSGKISPNLVTITSGLSLPPLSSSSSLDRRSKKWEKKQRSYRSFKWRTDRRDWDCKTSWSNITFCKWLSKELFSRRRWRLVYDQEVGNLLCLWNAKTIETVHNGQYLICLTIAEIDSSLHLLLAVALSNLLYRALAMNVRTYGQAEGQEKRLFWNKK